MLGWTLARRQIGVLWFWPASAPAAPTVSVSFNRDGDSSKPGSVCGLLVSSKDGQLVVQGTVGTTKEAVPIQGSWVATITVKDACP